MSGIASTFLQEARVSFDFVELRLKQSLLLTLMQIMSQVQKLFHTFLASLGVI